MRAIIQGEVLEVSPWEFQGRKGNTLSVLQLNGRYEVARIAVPDDFDIAQVPAPRKAVRCTVDIRTGYEGKGYKLRLVGVEPA